MTLLPPLLGRGSLLGEWRGVLIANLSGFERGERKDMTMASARLLGVILLPGEATSEEHGLRTSLLGIGVSADERIPCRLTSHPEGRREGGDRGIPRSSGEKRITPPLPLYSWWRTSHLTFF